MEVSRHLRCTWDLTGRQLVEQAHCGATVDACVEFPVLDRLKADSVCKRISTLSLSYKR